MSNFNALTLCAQHMITHLAPHLDNFVFMFLSRRKFVTPDGPPFMLFHFSSILCGLY